MNKLSKLSLYFVTLIISVLSVFSVANAQSVLCPVGYTCSPITVVSNCPVGFTCVPNNTIINPTGVTSGGTGSISGTVGGLPGSCGVLTFPRQIGSVGTDVVALQTFLIDRGFTIPSISSGVAAKGYFGTQTQAALMGYQKSAGLGVTGMADASTVANVNSMRCYPYPSPSKSPITVISPNGGETWTQNTTQTIKWSTDYPQRDPQGPQGILSYTTPVLVDIMLRSSSTNVPPCVGLGISCPLSAYPASYPEAAPYVIAKGVSNSGSYTWTVGRVADDRIVIGNVPGQYTRSISDGSYLVQVCTSGAYSCDSSDSSFKIVSSN